MISPEAGAWIAHAVFAVVLVWGSLSGRIGGTAAAIFGAIWIAAFVARPYIPYGEALFGSFVALVDVVLVLLVFKGDVRLT